MMDRTGTCSGIPVDALKLGSVCLLLVKLDDQLEAEWLEECVDWKMMRFKIAKPYRRSLKMWVKWLWGD